MQNTSYKGQRPGRYHAHTSAGLGATVDARTAAAPEPVAVQWVLREGSADAAAA